MKPKDSAHAISPNVLLVNGGHGWGAELKQMLEKIGLRPELVTSSREAIYKVKENHYQIVFIDNNPQGMHGISLLWLIRTVAEVTQVVMVADEVDEEQIKRAAVLGAIEWLRLPLNANQLERVLKKMSQMTTDNIVT